MPTLQSILFALLVFLCSHASAATLAQINQTAISQTGFVDIVYDKKEAKTYLKITNLGNDFIYQTSLPWGLGSNDIGLDRGQLSETRLAVFERAGNTVFLKQKPTEFKAITDNAKEAAAIEQAFASSILWGFPVIDAGQGWVLVDASDFVLQDIHGVGRRLDELKQGEGYSVDKSRSALDTEYSKSFPDNTELRATITLTGSKPGNFIEDTVPEPHAITLKMQHSFVRLPDDNYVPRKYHPKSGYWAVGYRDYAQPINADLRQRFIGRHRLEKTDPESAISTAVEPIIYYLDPWGAEPVRSALIDGARWWNQGFEALGYKDAFQVKLLPEGADPMDVRYNVIQWVHRSTRGWSYGYGIADPRTGEIIKGHVTLGSLRVRQDYLIAQGMMSPFGNEDRNADAALMKLALARIRQLSAHEVGHTLGINHNFAASAYGRESVMDYPHPLFELNDGEITAPNAYGVGLGKWDKAVIAYGYADIDPAKEEATLQQMIKQTDEDGLLYLSDPDARHPGSAHATASLWDNGSDAVAELLRMAELRSTALANFGVNTLQTGRSWADLEEILVPVYFFHRYQVAAAAKWVGGLEYDYSSKDNNRSTNGLSVVSGSRQQTAIDALLSTVKPEFLSLPASVTTLILPKEVESSRSRESIHGGTGVSLDPLAMASAAAQHSLSLLLIPQRLERLAQQSASDDSIPNLNELFEQVHQKIVDQEFGGGEGLIHQRVVDLIYSNYLNLLYDASISVKIKAELFAALNKAQRYHDKKSRSGDNAAFHALQAKRLDNLDINEAKEKITLPAMPPGSPI